MDSEVAQPTSARFRRWFGWTTDTPVVAVSLDDDVASVLCLRRRAVITASGRVGLPPGTVRNGRFRVAGPAVQALALLRDELDFPDRCRAIVLVQPRSTSSTGATVTAEIDGEEMATRRQVAEAAGFTSVALEPVPAALARLGLSNDAPVYAEGSGWRTYTDRDHLEIEPSERRIADAIIGPSPVERVPLPGPHPILVDPSVRLVAGWPLLLGAALGDGGHRPTSRIETTASNPAGSWTVERVATSEGGRR